MRKFLSNVPFALIILLVLFIIGWVAKDICTNKIMDRCETSEYSYFIYKKGVIPFRTYHYEFIGGTVEQRRNHQTAPFYSRGSDMVYKSDTNFELQQAIKTWREMQSRQ